MAELYDILVSEVQDDVAKLRVTSVHPDAGPIRPSVTFAFMLLLDPIRTKRRGTQKSPLDGAVDGTSDDRSWFVDNAKAFVRKATVEAASGKQATLVVSSTDPAWLSHLAPGMR